ncbi:hypothetical protein Csa_017613 [Cucumis sativus]|uniref:Uncharacterized protein n=1 Tax=Cucumis sativus TaxID=3659 RepID=A0A0A0LC08_CUCSA|nr:hypothetical protein Csa_017613 [Cucumis sativus]
MQQYEYYIPGEEEEGRKMGGIEADLGGILKNLDLQLQRGGREIGEKGMEYSEEETEEGTKKLKQWLKMEERMKS